MQHALMRTFEEWRRDSSAEALDIEHYERAGRIEGALHQHAEKLWASLSTEHRAWAARIFRCLTTSESGRPVRRPAPLERILRIVGASTEIMQAQVESVLETFEAPDCSFLTVDRTEELGAASVIDIAHESLIAHWKRLDDWVKEESESADWYKRLVRAAELHARGQAALWSDPDLRWAWTRRSTDGWNADWADQYGSGYPQAIAFLEESKRAQEVKERAEKERADLELHNARRQADAERRAKRNYLVLAVALAGLLAAAVFLAVQAQHLAGEARVQQKRAEGLAVQSDILTNRATEAERRAQAALKDVEATSALGAEADRLRKEAADARLQADASAKLAAQLEQKQSSLSNQTSQTIDILNKQITTLRAQLTTAQKAPPPSPEVVVLREWQVYIPRVPGLDGRALLFVTGLPSADGRATLFLVAERPNGVPLPLKLRSGDTIPQEGQTAWLRSLADTAPKKGDPASNYLVHAFPLTIKSRIVQPVPEGMSFEYNAVKYEIKVTGKNRIGALTDGAITVVLYPAPAHR
jgi:hypothetical protein